MWLKPDLMGPQKGPAVLGRIRAQWRQVDVENREAIAVRRQWMEMIGCDQNEITESITNQSDFDLVEELDKLRAVIEME
jgi:hypothetical protein